MSTLFQACYEIDTDMSGAPVFSVNLAVHTPSNTLSGIGHITQATNPPLEFATKIHGTYVTTFVRTVPDKIIVIAQGYPVTHWLPYGGVGPVILPNVELTMVLAGDWQSGTANYKYRDSDGNWQEVKDASVRSVSCDTV